MCLQIVRREWDVFCVVDVIVADLALLCFGEIDALITLLQIWQRASPAGARQTRHETVLASVSFQVYSIFTVVFGP